MELKEILNDFRGEINKSLETTTPISNDKVMEYTFTVNNIPYIVNITRNSVDMGRLLSSYNMKSYTPKDDSKFIMNAVVSFYALIDNKKKFGTTNTGHEFEVFSGVQSCIKQYLDDFEIDSLFFIAKDEAKIKLYDMFIKIFEREGYKSDVGFKGNCKGYFVYNPELDIRRI